MRRGLTSPTSLRQVVFVLMGNGLLTTDDTLSVNVPTPVVNVIKYTRAARILICQQQ